MTSETQILTAADAKMVLGEYDHSIRINDGFTIIYGPNGVGKTKFLEMIKYATDVNGVALSQIPFGELVLSYSDQTSLVVQRTLDVSVGGVVPSERSGNVLFSYFAGGVEVTRWEFRDDGLSEWARRRTRFEEQADGSWADRSNGEIISTEDLIEMYERRPGSRRKASSPLPAKLKSFRARHSAHLIKAQRLESVELADPQEYGWGSPARPRRKTVSKVSNQAETIMGLLNDAQTEHSKVTQKLDRTFPHRILSSAREEKGVDSDEIRRRYERQDDLRGRVAEVASVSMGEELPLPDEELEPWALRLLELYLDDAEEKLRTFAPLLKKVELLESILNDRLLGKTLRISDSEGMTVARSGTGEVIPLDHLSSGEQHEIILMIDLLFTVPRGAVVLIDEPEISLHVAWQLAFIPDVRKIAKLAGFNFIVATHSPQIINDKWNRAVRLGPPEASFQ